MLSIICSLFIDKHVSLLTVTLWCTKDGLKILNMGVKESDKRLKEHRRGNQCCDIDSVMGSLLFYIHILYFNSLRI